MDGDEQVGLVLVGNLSTTVEFYKRISLPGVDHLHVGTVLFHHSSEGKGIPQCQVFLLHLCLSDGTRITTAMTGVDHECEVLLRCHGTKGEKQAYTYYYIS